MQVIWQAGFRLSSSGNASDMMMALSMLNFSADAELGGDTFPSFDLEIDCFSPYMIITNRIWQRDDPLHYSLPLVLLQVLIITLTSRALQPHSSHHDRLWSSLKF